MAGRGSYDALPTEADADHDVDHGLPAPPPVSTIARRRPVPDGSPAAPDDHHLTARAQSTEGLGIHSPTSGAFGAALHGHRDGKPGNVADTLQGTPFLVDKRLLPTMASAHRLTGGSAIAQQSRREQALWPAMLLRSYVRRLPTSSSTTGAGTCRPLKGASSTASLMLQPQT